MDLHIRCIGKIKIDAAAKEKKRNFMERHFYIPICFRYKYMHFSLIG